MASEINNFVGDGYFQYVYIIDSQFYTKMILDTFTDLLWVERYCGYGEFEMTLPVRQDIIDTCHINDYVTIRESDAIMIIETIEVHTDVVNGNTIKISGKTLDSLLSRRIILNETIGTIDNEGNASKIGVQEAISMMLNDNVINPSSSLRKIPGFSFKPSTDPNITSPTILSFKDRGTSVYDKILSICQDNNIGFRILPIGQGDYQFELYFGVNRSYDQNILPPVVFSDKYENLPTSDYLETITSLKNVVYVKWDAKWTVQTYGTLVYRVDDFVTVWNDRSVVNDEEKSEVNLTEAYKKQNPSGLDRFESFIEDGGDTYDLGTYGPYILVYDDPSKHGGVIWIPDPIPDYVPNRKSVQEQTFEKGKEYLSDYETTTYFEGETEPHRQFVYGRDYFMGDIVQLVNEYGQTGKCRISEVVRSRDGSGVNMTLTFEKVEE